MDLSYTEIDRESTEFGELLLRKYTGGGETGYEILLDGAFLMASHGSHSERAMAEIAWRRLPPPRSNLAALVGGLGAGHTLRAVLDLDGVARVTVAEIGERVVDWNRRHFAEVNGHAVDDPRVDIRIADVRSVIESGAGSWDLVLLDVDNGPGWLATPANAALYSLNGLRSCRNALARGGVAAIWSPARNAQLREDLEAVFDHVEAIDTSRIGRREGEPGSLVYVGSEVYLSDRCRDR